MASWRMFKPTESGNRSLCTKGQVLDGRNRYKAGVAAGVDIPTKEFKGSALAALDYVWSLNRKRRHLNSSQAAIADAKRQKLYAVYAAVEEDAKKREQSGKGQDGSGGRGRKRNPVEFVPQGLDADDRKTRTIRAKTAGTNPKYIDAADELLDEHPDLAEQVERGEKTLTQVQRELREQKREDRRQENAIKAADTPDLLSVGAKFATILIDPPWDWGDEGDVNQLGRAKPDYHTMTLEELLALPVGDLADDDCHLYCWVTNRRHAQGLPVDGGVGFSVRDALDMAEAKHGDGELLSGTDGAYRVRRQGQSDAQAQERLNLAPYVGSGQERAQQQACGNIRVHRIVFARSLSRGLRANSTDGVVYLGG